MQGAPLESIHADMFETAGDVSGSEGARVARF